ncbi:MAG: dienelactone hydrolase, partial [Acidobacteria bacterium]
MTLTTQPVRYHDETTTLNGLFFWDGTRQDRRPGVLIVHGGAGLDDHAKGRARRFAESGFVALACDMYGEGVVGNRERVMRCITDFQQDPGRLCRRAQPALDLLMTHPQVDGRLAAVGYCFGGMVVLELARSGIGLAGVVSVHGSLATNRPASPGTIKAKLLVCHGALDPHVPTAQVTGFADEMSDAGV